MTYTHRSQSIATLTLIIALGALAGCKGGDGGSSGTSAAPATTSNSTPSTSAPDANGNHAPTISGTAPTTAAPNASYSFAPTANDADGDQVTFQIQNKPSWATFNTVTGQLSGTPSSAHQGVYANVTITANDGKSSAALPAFTITVGQAPVSGAVGAATLSWMAPTENTDGTALSNLAGFVIAYGTSSTTLNQSVRIENPSVSSHVFQDLPAGTYYFGIKAYTHDGSESELSTMVSKQIG